MADEIKNLPQSQEIPSDIDVNVMRDIFGQGIEVAKTVDYKKLIIPAIVFIVLSLPVIDKLLGSVVSESETILIFTKTLIFVIILVILQLAN
jgi:hypothetical protein